MCVCVCVCFAPPVIPPTLLPHNGRQTTYINITLRHRPPHVGIMLMLFRFGSWYFVEQAQHFPRTFAGITRRVFDTVNLILD